ncbi:MAG: hypothetical protein HYU64_06165 [Armatimonadetes bacterium]|nr:hypothetical protein [Armatimonadota bacterium]
MGPLSERVLAAIRGKPVDRPPVTFWRHFYDRETTAEGLASAMVSFQLKYDWDLLKVNPRACYHVQDWGARFRFSGNPHVKPEMVESPIKGGKDLASLRKLSPTEGVLGDHLRAIRMIFNQVGQETFVVMTLFTPLSIAGDLVGSVESLKRYMNESPEAVHEALSVITETFSSFAPLCLKAGASGIFYATTHWATRTNLTEKEYEVFGKPYDLKLLAAFQDAPLNILHVCKSENMLGILSDYPVAAFSWTATDPANPTLAEGKELTGKCVMGGIDHETTLQENSREDLSSELERSVRETSGSHWIAAPGCAVSSHTPEENLRHVRGAITGFSSGRAIS